MIIKVVRLGMNEFTVIDGFRSNRSYYPCSEAFKQLTFRVMATKSPRLTRKR